MTIHLGDEAPDFVAETTQGEIRFHEWKRGKWALLVSHPADFTPVCTTELAALAALSAEFERRDTSVIAVSVDPLDTHFRWLNDIERLAGAPVDYPIAADPNRWITKLYGMIHPSSGRSAVRVAVLIDPDDRVRLMLAYPACTGRDFGELLRVLDSLQLADRYGVATPAGWRSGQDVIVPLDISASEAEERFPKGLEAKTPYLRMTPQPSSED
jgi:alkyl hydroperoxide reductase subunit AhpC